MAELNHTAAKVNTIVATTIEDICKVLLEIMAAHEGSEIDRDFFKKMKKQEQMPIMEIMESSISKRYVQELEKHAIPYVRYEVVGSSKDVIVISPDDKERAMAIESNMRIRAGLEIDTKYELDRVMAVVYPGEMEARYDGLTRFQADSIIQAGKELPKPVTIVAEKGPDDKYTLFCHSKYAPVVNNLILDFAVNMSNHSQEMQDAVKSQQYFQKEKTEFLNAVEHFRETGRGREAYLFSYEDPSKYILIREDGFDVYRNGNRVNAMNISSNPALFPDVLKFIGSTLEKPIYKTSEEVINLGGAANVYKEAASQIPCKNPEKIFDKGRVLKQWAAKKLNLDTTAGFNIAGTKRLSIQDFLNETTELSDSARRVIESHKGLFQKQLDEVVETLSHMSMQKEIVRIENEDIFHLTNRSLAPDNEKLKKAHHDTVYSVALYENVKNGGGIDDRTVPETEKTDTQKTPENRQTTVKEREKDQEQSL